MKRIIGYIGVFLLAVSAGAGSSHAIQFTATSEVCGQKGALPATCGNIVFDGDSISAGWGSSNGHGLDIQFMGDLGVPARVTNVAVGGRPVLACLRAFDNLVAPYFARGARFNLIVFHAGDNDIAQGRDAEQTYAAFEQYVAKAHAQGWKVVVSTELQRPDFRPDKQAALSEYNRLLLANAAHADVVVNVASDRRMADLAARSDPTLFAPDHIHPRDAGYAILAKMLATAVRPLLPQ